MKVLFVCKSMAIENLGVMYLSSVVKQAGHEAKIIDIENAFMFSKLWKPEMIGFSVMTGDQRRFLSLADEIKAYWVRKKSAPAILVGGPHVTFFPEDFKDNDNINLIVKGEGEEVLAELLHSEAQYPSIDDLPWPDRTCFSGHKIRDFIASRGCPYNCSYCYSDRWAKMFPEYPRVRTRSVKDVVDEVASVQPDFAYFQDSCFGTNIKWFREFSKEYRSKANIPYHAHARPNQINEEQVLLLHDSNCFSIRIALETSSDRLRRMINRPNTTNEETYKAAKLLKKWGIKLMVQNMLGLCDSTIEDDLNTLEVNIRCKPDYAWSSIFAPYPGTELGELCIEKGWFKGDYNDISDNFFERSVLEFTEERKEQTYYLQKVFALCADTGYLPDVKELTQENFPKLVHKIMRRQGDQRLYGGAV